VIGLLAPLPERNGVMMVVGHEVDAPPALTLPVRSLAFSPSFLGRLA